MSKTTTTTIDRANPIEKVWLRAIGCKPKPRKSGTVRSRIMSDTEARAYGVDLKTVRSNRAKKARAAHSVEREAVAETVERIAETGEVLTW